MGVKKESMEKQIAERLGEEALNKQGCLMKIVEYNDASDIIVEFQDEYKARVHTSYSCFKNGQVKNLYFPSVRGIGIIGNKYHVSINRQRVKEYATWYSMLQRCFDEKYKEKNPAYMDVTCCEEWLLYENFYEWLHEQDNFDKWFNNYGWTIDKDILVKGNKVYSPDVCCLVPRYVNSLFTNAKNIRGDLPVGMTKSHNKFRCTVEKYKNKTFLTVNEAFLFYKNYKEETIKKVAELEYAKSNITKECYKAMMNYQVEIDD